MNCPFIKKVVEILFIRERKGVREIGVTSLWERTVLVGNLMSFIFS